MEWAVLPEKMLLNQHYRLMFDVVFDGDENLIPHGKRLTHSIAVGYGGLAA